MEGHIYIYGDIYKEQVEDAGSFGIVNLKEVQAQIQSNKDATKLIVHINSRGGDVNEGFAIHDVLVNSGKEVETIIEGLCASIATIVSLAGTERKMLENSEFFIHNPWGMAVGDADEVAAYSTELEAAEKRILDFYVAKTGGDADTLKAAMKKQTNFTSTEAKDLGFITEVISTTEARKLPNRMPIAAFKTNKNNNDMSEIKAEIKKTNNVLSAILNKIGIKNEKPQAKTYTLESGETIETNSTEDLAVDQIVNDAEGNVLASGDYQVADGPTITIGDKGVVTNVKQPEATDMEALKTENETLKAKVAELEADKVTSDAAIKDFGSKLELIQKNLKPGNYTPPANTQTFKGKKGEPSLKEQMDARRAEIEAKKK